MRTSPTALDRWSAWSIPLRSSAIQNRAAVRAIEGFAGIRRDHGTDACDATTIEAGGQPRLVAGGKLGFRQQQGRWLRNLGLGASTSRNRPGRMCFERHGGPLLLRRFMAAVAPVGRGGGPRYDASIVATRRRGERQIRITERAKSSRANIPREVGRGNLENSAAATL